MVTTSPTAPVVGEKEVIVGSGGHVMMKVSGLPTLLQPTVIKMFPSVAPAGTFVVILVDVLLMTSASTLFSSPKTTRLSSGVTLKFVPVIITVVPIGPDAG